MGIESAREMKTRSEKESKTVNSAERLERRQQRRGGGGFGGREEFSRKVEIEESKLKLWLSR